MSKAQDKFLNDICQSNFDYAEKHFSSLGKFEKIRDTFIVLKDIEDEDYDSEYTKWGGYMNEVIIYEKEISIILNYPLNEAYKFKVSSKHGFSTRLLAERAVELYKKIYAEEEKTSRIKIMSLDERVKKYDSDHRNRTNGKYGIFGYEWENLSIENIYYNKHAKEVKFFIGS